MIPWSIWHAAVHRLLRQRSLLPPDSSVLVAVSGGQDSICLLKLLADLRSKWNWYLQVVHCDHRWRTDSGDNARFVADLCGQWQIPCRVITADAVPNGEAAARYWRYEVFTTVAIEHQCTHVVTGHTATDRAETLLYNLMRGSGADGLQALSWQRSLSDTYPALQVVRPILHLTRQQTAEFCTHFHLAFWRDATNDDIAYTRNRIRLELMPYLKQHFNSDIESTLVQTAELLTAEVAFLDKLAADLYQQVVQPPPGDAPWRIARNPLKPIPLALQRRVMRQFLQQVMSAQVSFDHVEKLVALIHAPNRTQTDPFPGNLLARVAGDWIVLQGLE
jgi:tRNA(Ile)-lysidine synthase